MAEIDPVILQLRADLGQYLGTLRSTTTKVDQLLGTQEKKVKQLERQFQRSSGAISGSLRGLAGSLATYFTGRELVGLIDNFTRLQNSLRVAGLEGASLASVQERLFAIGAKYGTSVNALADLYGKNAQSAAELGANQQQLLSITEATSQALLITGVSTAQASGAILGLSQALSAGTVRAEEFNQINEGGLRPLLAAAAASDRWGGSVAKLRAEVLAGKVSSQEFFAAILAGSQQLEGQASKATLTLAGSMQVLTDQLGRYVGSAASANGVTGALSAGIAGLANNLDRIIPAIAVLATALGIGFVTNAIRARLAAAAVTAATLGVAGAAGTAGVAVGTLGRVLLGAFGGPIGIAIIAISAALYLLTQRTGEADQAARQKANADLKMAEASRVAELASRQLADASEKERAALIASMQASRARAAQSLQTAKAQLVEARAAIAVARANAQAKLIDETSDSGGSIDTAAAFMGDRGRQSKINSAQAKVDAAEAKAAIAEGALDGLDQAIKAASAPVKLAPTGVSAKPSGSRGGSGAGSGAGPSGPSAAETAQRAAEEQARLDREILQAKIGLATNAEDRLGFERELRFTERDQRIAQVENDKDFTRAQKDAQIAAIRTLYGTDTPGEISVTNRPSLYGQQANREFDRRQIELALMMIDAEQGTLSAEQDIETNIAKRRDIERKMLELQQTAERMRFEEAVAAGDVADATKARALLERKQLAERKSLGTSQLSPGAAYVRDLGIAGQNIDDAVGRIQVQGLQSLNDQLVDAILNAKNLGDVFKNVASQIIGDLLRIAIQQAIIKPLAEKLFGGGGASSGGGIGSVLSGLTSLAGLFGGGGGSKGASAVSGGLSALFGRASGGYVAPGQMVRVNEGATPGKVEGFMSRDGGQIIPLGRMNVAPGGGGGQPAVVQVHVMEGQLFEPRVQAISGNVSVEVIRSAAPALIDASARETMARAGRPRI